MVHLHLHSHYSVLDGLGKVPEIVARAKELGAPAVAITDHASISAMPDLFKEAKAVGVKPIIGCEFYVTDKEEADKEETPYHLTVLAKNWGGVQSIMRRLTMANRQFYKRPRISWKQALDFDNCIVMTACAQGLLAHDNYQELAANFLRRYGEDFYLEIMPHNVSEAGGLIDKMRLVNERAVALHGVAGFNLVATNDAHYVKKDDAYTHEILLAIQSGKAWDDPKRWRWNTDALYMRSLPEMAGAFVSEASYLPIDCVKKALQGAYKVAERCNVELPAFTVHLPSLYGDKDQDVFAKVTMTGWDRLILGKVPKDLHGEYYKRLSYEVGVINKLGFIRYFLMIHDIITWARKNGIMVGPARGSAAGSLVCYLMGITQVDPIKHGLYFERFLNPERIDLPDIDIDFQDDRRQEVFDYITTKYGKDYTANINTFGQLTLNSAFRDVARTFGISPIQINYLSKQIDGDDSFEEIPDLVKFAAANPNIVEQAKRLSGTIRQQGVHACGIVISSEELVDVSAIERRKDDVEVVNWDMRVCEKFGLLKADVLGLTTLTILSHAAELIKKRHEVEIDFPAIPLDDPDTLAAFSRGEGQGVFQFENSGMQKLLKDLGANTFQTITDTTALFRPGSLQSGETAKYVQVANGHKYEEYVDEKLRPILSPTRGVLVYQEQIMQVFNQLGGFTWAEADKMRKIVGKKLGKDEFEKHRAHFAEGCAKNGVDGGAASEIFDKMVEFASYSFNKSHAVAYTMISFWCMFLKQHYALEWFTAHLSHCAPGGYLASVKEAKAKGITVERPDINLSGRYFRIGHKWGTIISPLGVIKGLGDKAVGAILEAREKGGVFASLKDFEERVDRRLVNVRIRETLIRAGAFEGMGIVEPLKEVREKNYAELLPIFNEAPSIDREDRTALDKVALEILYSEMVGHCSAERSKSKAILSAKGGARPIIMVINNPVKGEVEHLTNKGTKFFLDAAREYGFTPADFYYTSPIKCFHPNPREVSKDCRARCLDFLKKEIAIVAPKLILCFSSDVLNMFVSDKKPTMGKLNGELVYNREFDTYVLFSYSPQYVYYGAVESDGSMTENFKKTISKMAEVFV